MDGVGIHIRDADLTFCYQGVGLFDITACFGLRSDHWCIVGTLDIYCDDMLRSCSLIIGNTNSKLINLLLISLKYLSIFTRVINLIGPLACFRVYGECSKAAIIRASNRPSMS